MAAVKAKHNKLNKRGTPWMHDYSSIGCILCIAVKSIGMSLSFHQAINHIHGIITPASLF